MKILFIQYAQLVKAEYERKKSTDELSRFRVKSTTAKLKEECLAVFAKGLQPRDQQTLKNYFDVANDGTVTLQLIRKTEPDKFKALDKYLKGELETTNERNTELLAWLIDSRHRPWLPGKDFELSDEEKAIISKTVTLPPPPPPPPPPSGPGSGTGTGKVQEPTKKTGSDGGLSIKKPVMILLLTFIGIGVLYTVYSTVWQPVGCMYWNGDQYVPVDCSAEPSGRVVLPLDVEQMKNFLRVTQKDTITEWSIGKLYYIKHRNKIEYYTYSGNYPEDLNRYVKRLSQYIFDKDKENRK